MYWHSHFLSNDALLQLEQVKKLVEGAVPGDHFFFHCWFHASLYTYPVHHELDSGHATQIPNKTRSEEDGMDECASVHDLSVSLSIPPQASSR